MDPGFHGGWPGGGGDGWEGNSQSGYTNLLIRKMSNEFNIWTIGT